MNFSEILSKINPFRKKDELLSAHFAMVVPTGAASIMGADDDYTKEVVHVINGLIVEEKTKPYSEAYVDTLRKVQGIPVIIPEIDNEEYVEVDNYGDFGVLEVKKVEI